MSKVVANNPSANLILPFPLVTVIDTVATVIGRDIYMDVRAYNYEARAMGEASVGEWTKQQLLAEKAPTPVNIGFPYEEN
ncbi:hypothetical protein OPQ81_006947 [Rhizoctonia solani]|nr:hypothetical protein OPQ81_006947 [Rhizoctonia solani]